MIIWDLNAFRLSKAYFHLSRKNKLMIIARKLNKVILFQKISSNNAKIFPLLFIFLYLYLYVSFKIFLKFRNKVFMIFAWPMFLICNTLLNTSLCFENIYRNSFLLYFVLLVLIILYVPHFSLFSLNVSNIFYFYWQLIYLILNYRRNLLQFIYWQCKFIGKFFY